MAVRLGLGVWPLPLVGCVCGVVKEGWANLEFRVGRSIERLQRAPSWLLSIEFGNTYGWLVWISYSLPCHLLNHLNPEKICHSWVAKANSYCEVSLSTTGSSLLQIRKYYGEHTN